MEENFKVPSLDGRIKFVPRIGRDSQIDKPLNEIFEEPSSTEQTETDLSNTSKTSSSKKQLTLKCSYVEPKWSQKPAAEHVYSFEVLKNGTICERLKDLQTRPFWLIGKLSDNHISMAHPTISRYHAVLQYRPEVKNELGYTEDNDNEAESKKSTIDKGWYLYDLNSTHGSFVNKMKIPPSTYVRVRVGYILKFGGSTRHFVFQGPNFDEEPESELSVTEIKEIHRKNKEEYLENQKAIEKQKESEGISWGMIEDADEETDLSINPFASTNNEELFLQDPKKTLRGYFEREGHDLDYKVDEMSPGTFLCRIELPINNSNGKPLIAELCLKGKKKECVHQCALEACRILDRHGVLRQSCHESRKRKIEHHSDSDDDEFYDRTGDVERKKQQRQAGNQKNALSYSELLEQEQELLRNLDEVNFKIETYKNAEKELKKKSNREDDFDDFMSNLTNDKPIDKMEIRKLRFHAQRLKNDHIDLKRLINIVRPVDLIPLHVETKIEGVKKPQALPLFGKRRTFKYSTLISQSKINKTNKVEPSTTSKVQPLHNEDKEEIEEVENSDEKDIETMTDSSKSNEVLEDHKSMKHTSLTIESPEQIEKSKREESINEKRLVIKSGEHNYQSIIGGIGSSSATKKKRNRIRIRNDKGRENVDFDEEMNDAEKYSTWLPPQDQSGDGNTDLNDKYGY